MTLKELRGRWLSNIQNLNPVVVVPDLNGLTREGIRALTRATGGIQRSTTITTVAGTREYGTDSDFPSDFLKVSSVWRSTVRLWPINRRERNESSSRGTPARYYIWARSIGFNVPPSSGVGDITFNYYGLSDDVTDDTDVVLAEFSAMDDDPFWDAITDHCEIKYYKRKRAMAYQKGWGNELMMLKSLIVDKTFEYRVSKAYAIKQIRAYNADRALQFDLPEDYFALDRNTFTERASNYGDVIRRW